MAGSHAVKTLRSIDGTVKTCHTVNMNAHQEKAAADFYERVRKIRRLIDAGMRKVEVARAIGVSRQRLYQIISEAKSRGLM